MAAPIFNTGVVPGYDDTLDQSKRAREYANLLRQRMMQNDSPKGVHMGLMAALAPLAQGFMAGQTDRMADDFRQDASKKYTDFLEGERAGIDMIVDPKKRADRALRSPVPFYQKYGETLMSRLPTLKDLAGVSTPQTALQGMRSGDENAFQALPKFQEVGGVPHTVTAEGGIGAPAVRPFFQLTTDPNKPGEKIQQNSLTGQYSGMRPGQTDVSVSTGGPNESAYDKKVAEAAAKSFIDSIDRSYEGATAAIADTKVLKSAITQLQDNPNQYAGPTSDIRSKVVMFADVLGLAPDDALRNATDSALLQRTLADRVLAKAKSLGTGSGFSNTDLQFLEEATKGKGLPVDGLFKLFDMGIRANLGTVAAHQHLLNRSNKRELPAGYLEQKDLHGAMSSEFSTPLVVSPIRDEKRRAEYGFRPLGPVPAAAPPAARQPAPAAPGQPMTPQEYLQRSRQGG